MKILVIGGTRFFGKRLVQMLVHDGDPSPYGEPEDWTMDTSTITAAGFHPLCSWDWVQDTIRVMSADYISTK